MPNAPRPLRNRTIQRFHIGTNLATASIYLIDREELSPGEGGFVQLRLDRAIVALPQDRFVIRGSSIIQTCGGGVILDTHPDKHKRFSEKVISDLTLLRDGSGEEALRQHILHSGIGGIILEDLLKRVAVAPNDVQVILRRMVERKELILIDPERLKVVDFSQYQKLREIVLSQLKEFHGRFPMKSGLAKEELRTKLPAEGDIKLFQILIGELTQSGKIVLEKDKLRLTEHRVSSSDEKGLVKKVEEAILKGGLQPPSPRELADAWSEKEEGIQAIFEHLVHEGILVKIKSGIYFHCIPFEHLKESLIQNLKKNREITTPQFKEMTGASRKYAIPLIEYFDQIKLTLRLGDKRVLRAGKEG